MNLIQINKEYDKMQELYGDISLDSVKNGGEDKNPDYAMIFMNPTSKNISCKKDWKGLKAPWISTKDIWNLFLGVNLIDENIFNEIKSKKQLEWDEAFAQKVYDNVKKHSTYITNLGKCTQIDARPLKDSVFKKYLELLYEEIYLVNPKIIFTFGNQVSSIILKEKISVTKARKIEYSLTIKDRVYKVFPIHYPVGNARYNMPKSVEDINYVKDNYDI